MPLITIRVTGKPVTAEQKQKLISGSTDLVVDVLGKNPDSTWVIIEEISPDDWGAGGKSVSQRTASS